MVELVSENLLFCFGTPEVRLRTSWTILTPQFGYWKYTLSKQHNNAWINCRLGFYNHDRISGLWIVYSCACIVPSHNLYILSKYCHNPNSTSSLTFLTTHRLKTLFRNTKEFKINIYISIQHNIEEHDIKKNMTKKKIQLQLDQNPLICLLLFLLYHSWMRLV